MKAAKNINRNLCRPVAITVLAVLLIAQTNQAATVQFEPVAWGSSLSNKSANPYNKLGGSIKTWGDKTGNTLIKPFQGQAQDQAEHQEGTATPAITLVQPSDEAPTANPPAETPAPFAGKAAQRIAPA